VRTNTVFKELKQVLKKLINFAAREGGVIMISVASVSVFVCLWRYSFWKPLRRKFIFC